MDTFKSGKIHLYKTKLLEWVCLNRRLSMYYINVIQLHLSTICHMSIVYLSGKCLQLYAIQFVLDILLILLLASQGKAYQNVGIDVNQVKHCAS